MAKKTLKQLDAEYGRKMKREENRMKKVNKKRLKEFTYVSPVGKKTQWYY